MNIVAAMASLFCASPINWFWADVVWSLSSPLALGGGVCVERRSQVLVAQPSSEPSAVCLFVVSVGTYIRFCIFRAYVGPLFLHRSRLACPISSLATPMRAPYVLTLLTLIPDDVGVYISHKLLALLWNDVGEVLL